MPRFARRALTGAVLGLAALSPAVASAQSPTLRVHAIFSGGQASSFHVGQVLDIDVRSAGGRKLTQDIGGGALGVEILAVLTEPRDHGGRRDPPQAVRQI